MKYRRAILYDVSSGTAKFHSAVTLHNNVKDPSSVVYNTTIELFPSIDTRNLNIMIHGNDYIACVVEMMGGFVVKTRALISCICRDIEVHSNGNILYNDTTIIKYGKPDSKDKYGYSIFDKNMQNAGYFKVFDSLEDACAYIDHNQ